MTEVSNAHQGFAVGNGRHPGRCSQCNAEFEGIRPGMTLCFGCWYKGELEKAEADFLPLIAAVEGIGWKWQVEQTGGMVMCLSARPGEALLPYCMWGHPDEWEDKALSFSVYLDEEESEQDLWVNVNGPHDHDLMARFLVENWDDLLVLAGNKLCREAEINLGGFEP